ncbi:flagellar biosynthetic protein FliR [Alicyclobacillus cellulosilyticus]|uniref:Flagellar biosynthetic protein FliR n=2 Tax=Alicyclobacillus cellulosilyticus TaxID=1003997 RepID=A0A917NG05_9BACL|nr:flagellar biosynthetic protein FliR [Alicyclobacillus cellulosilyticus]
MQHVEAFILVLLRMASFVAASPVFSLRVWPAWAKAGFAAFCAVLVVPEVSAQPVPPFAQAGRFLGDAAAEVVTGLLLGTAASVVFTAAQMAGQLLDIQIGYAAAALFDPVQGQASGPLANWTTILFTLYFLGVGGLDGLVLAALHSYDWVPLGGWRVRAGGVPLVTSILGLAMTGAVEAAAPTLAALLLLDVTFAFLSRAVPQLNVFVVSLPVKLLLGLGFCAATVPALVFTFDAGFRALLQALDAMLRWMGG